MNALLSWILKVVLSWAASWAEKKIKTTTKDIKADKEAGVINETNVKKHDSATSRLEQIKAAEDLLNRSNTP